MPLNEKKIDLPLVIKSSLDCSTHNGTCFTNIPMQFAQFGFSATNLNDGFLEEIVNSALKWPRNTIKTK